MRTAEVETRTDSRVPGRRTRLLLALALVAAVLGSAAVGIFDWPPWGATDESGGGSQSAPALDTEQDPAGVERLPEAEVGEPVDFGTGLVATVTEIDEIDVEATGHGETSGPGVAIKLELSNESSDQVDLALLAVDAIDADSVPAAPMRGEPAEWVSGALEPGETTEGVYVFRFDGDAADLRIDVYHAASPNIVVIRE